MQNQNKRDKFIAPNHGPRVSVGSLGHWQDNPVRRERRDTWDYIPAHRLRAHGQRRNGRVGRIAESV